MAKRNMAVIEDCWNTFAAISVPDGVPEKAQDFMMSTFYAGAAFMFDLMMTNVDDEPAAMAMLDSVSEELDQHSRQLAAAAGVDLEWVRREIKATLRKKRGR